MKTFTRIVEFPLSAVTMALVAALTLSAPAHAEYRCANPRQLSHEEARACELARQSTPDALIHFVNRTKAVYDLYLNDYVSEGDVVRWELANRKTSYDSPIVARASGDTSEHSSAR